MHKVEEKFFGDEMKGEWDMHTADDLVMCLGDLNGHMGRHSDGFGGVHVGYCVVRGIWMEECH